MSKGKTRDGYKLSKLEKMMKDIPGVKIRSGRGGHNLIAMYDNMIDCPLVCSTNVEYMVVPWVKKITNLGRESIYQRIRKGKWY